jgi:hypothetical protein
VLKATFYLTFGEIKKVGCAQIKKVGCAQIKKVLLASISPLVR